jgi:hypothetical protein
MEWGPYAQYIITGQHNEHPRSAIDARDKYVEFYDKIVVDSCAGAYVPTISTRTSPITELPAKTASATSRSCT